MKILLKIGTIGELSSELSHKNEPLVNSYPQFTRGIPSGFHQDPTEDPPRLVKSSDSMGSCRGSAERSSCCTTPVAPTFWPRGS